MNKNFKSIIILFIIHCIKLNAQYLKLQDDTTISKSALHEKRPFIPSVIYGDTTIYKKNSDLLIDAQTSASKRNWDKAAKDYRKALNHVHFFEAIGFIDEAVCRLQGKLCSEPEALCLINKGYYGPLQTGHTYIGVTQRYCENKFLIFNNIAIYDSAHFYLKQSGTDFLSRHAEAVLNTMIHVGEIKEACQFAAKLDLTNINLTNNFFYLTAVAHFINEDISKALIYLDKALEKKPCVGVYQLQGNIFNSTNPKLSCEAFNRAYKLEKSEENILNLSKALLKTNYPQRTVKLLQPLWKHSKNNPEVGILLASGLTETEKYEEAKLVLQQVERIYKDKLPEKFYFEKGALYLNLFTNSDNKKRDINFLNTSENSFNMQLKSSDDPESYIGLSIVNFILNNHYKSYLYFQIIEEKFPGYYYSDHSLFIRTLLANYYDDELECRKILDEAMSREQRKGGTAYAIAALHYFFRNNLKKARYFANKSFNAEPENLFARMVLAAIDFQSGNAEEAILTYSEILNKEPDLSEAQSGLGLAQAEAGNFVSSLTTFENLLSKEFTARYLQNYSYCLYRMAENAKNNLQTDSLNLFATKALNLLAHAQKLNPFCSSYNNNMGVIYLLINDISCFAEVAGVESPASVNNFAVFNYFQNHIDVALENGQKAITMDKVYHDFPLSTYTTNLDIYLSSNSIKAPRYVVYYSIVPAVLNKKNEFNRNYKPTLPSYYGIDRDYEIFDYKSASGIKSGHNNFFRNLAWWLHL